MDSYFWFGTINLGRSNHEHIEVMIPNKIVFPTLKMVSVYANSETLAKCGCTVSAHPFTSRQSTYFGHVLSMQLRAKGL